VTVGFDMDGFSLARRTSGVHIAAIKGVIADEARFESGITKATTRMQAACEKRHVNRADLVITTSQYSSERVRELYKTPNAPHVIPELIDLSAWTKLSRENRCTAPAGKFIVLSVCRFYPRKRLHLLLRAAERLQAKIAGLELRLVGNGPEMSRLKSICRERSLQRTVTFLGNVSQADLAREYVQCHVFCLPSVQEGFGVVFLEAMAHGKPIVAARAGAAPEVVRHGLLAEPDNEEALAEAIERLYREPKLGEQLGCAGREFVTNFDAPMVARLFLQEMRGVIEAQRR